MNSVEAPAVPRHKRRYLLFTLFALLLIWVISIQAGCLAMRTPDREWSAKMQKKGQSLPPVFLDVPMAGGRSIHAISVAAEDHLPLIVLVHGSPGSADAFLSYLSDTLLSKVARLVTLDRPGFGYTSGFGRPEGSLERQAAAVEAVVQRLSNGEKVILVGHSLGGPVIARFTMEHPEQVAGLVLVAGSIDPDLEEHPWWQAAVDVAPLRWLIPKSFWTSNREIKLLEPELRAMLPRWADIRCPVTVVHAENDRLVPFANVDFARRMLVHCSNFQAITLPKGDHFILWSRPELVRQAIIDLIRPGAMY